MITPLVYVILSFVPTGIVALIVESWHRFHYNGKRLPITDRLLRAPGESCRQKVEELNNRISDVTMWVIGFPSTFILIILSSNEAIGVTSWSLKGWLLPIILAITAVGVMAWKLICLHEERNNWRLGFSGERAVGEQLNQLMTDGCRVCHDFPLSERGNIDHIVVAPSGVYAVETKTKTKRAVSASLQAHEVIYDGKTLEFPAYRDSRDLLQARQQAQHLSEFLSTALKSPQPVTPVLTLPGWYVISRGKGDVLVTNPKLLDREILSHEAPVLPPERIRDIARILEHKCRDVEF